MRVHVSAISRKNFVRCRKRSTFPLLPLVEPSFHKDKKFHCCLTIFRHPKDCTGTHIIQSIHLDPTPDQTICKLKLKGPFLSSGRKLLQRSTMDQGPSVPHPGSLLCLWDLWDLWRLWWFWRFHLHTANHSNGSGAASQARMRKEKKRLASIKWGTNQHKSSSMKK